MRKTICVYFHDSENVARCMFCLLATCSARVCLPDRVWSPRRPRLRRARGSSPTGGHEKKNTLTPLSRMFPGLAQAI